MQENPGVDGREELDEASNDPRPAGLMAGADASAVVTVKVFVEGNQVASMGAVCNFSEPP